MTTRDLPNGYTPETLRMAANHYPDLYAPGQMRAHADAWQAQVEALEAELVAVLEVSIARGEKLGYMDDDYRQRVVSLDPEASARLEEASDE